MYIRRTSLEAAIAAPTLTVVGGLVAAAFAAAAAQREASQQLAREWSAYNAEVAKRQAVWDAVDHEITDIRLRDEARRAKHRMEKRRLGLA